LRDNLDENGGGNESLKRRPVAAAGSGGMIVWGGTVRKHIFLGAP
jgi:hypothetical protein